MPTGDFDCPECGQPGPHFVLPSLGEQGFYSCAFGLLAQQRRARERAKAATRGRGRRITPIPIDAVASAKEEALRDTILEALEPPEFLIEPAGADWSDLEFSA